MVVGGGVVGWVWLAGPGVVGDSVVGLPCVVAVQEGAGGRKNGRLCVLKAWPIICRRVNNYGNYFPKIFVYS